MKALLIDKTWALWEVLCLVGWGTFLGHLAGALSGFARGYREGCREGFHRTWKLFSGSSLEVEK